MKPNTLLTVVVAVLLSTSGTQAQRVEPTLIDGCPVINCIGMPALSYSKTKKGNVVATLKTAVSNATLYQRFAVYNSGDNNMSATWLDAFAACSGASGIGVWRLPTQRELQLIWVLKRELELTANFEKFADRYWSATEYLKKDTTSFNVVFNGSAAGEGDVGDSELGNNTDKGGATSPNKQKFHYSVRCIRELN